MRGVPTEDCAMLVKQGKNYAIGKFVVDEAHGWYLLTNGLLVLKENFGRDAKYIVIDWIQD